VEAAMSEQSTEAIREAIRTLSRDISYVSGLLCSDEERRNARLRVLFDRQNELIRLLGVPYR
jgi:hypothetical protein